MANYAELLKKPSFLIKILELILAIVGVALYEDSIFTQQFGGIITTFGLLSDKNKVALVNMVYCGFVLITAMNIIGKVLDGIPKKLGTLWAIVGCILYIAAAGVILKQYSDVQDKIPPGGENNLQPELKKMLNEDLGAGIVGIINGVVHLVEFILIAKFETEE